MNCLLKSITNKGEFRNFSCDFINLETAFDFLNQVLNQGDTLLDVRLVDDDGYLILPTEAFDGESFQVPFDELENQWREILDKPISSPTINEVAETRNRWHSLQQKRRRHFAWMVENLEHQLRLMKKQTFSARIGRITERYESMLNYYQVLLAKQERVLSDRNSQSMDNQST